MNSVSTIFAISTAPGLGGIAVLRVSGPEAIIATERLFLPFRNQHQLTARPTHTLTFGQIMDGDSVLDEVVVSLFRAPHSFTGEEVVEISCHGSLYIQQRLLELFANLASEDMNIRLAEPGEFTRRAFANGRMDLSQAEAVADLISSQNAASHRLAMNQMRGSFSRKLDLLHDQLLRLSTLLELELDFSEEDVEFADRTELRQITTQIDDEVVRLSATFQTGQAIKKGIPVAIIGAPNVGKSTLLNALLRDDKAIVSDIQGTTRDLIEDTFQIQGHLFRFIDTAGIRQTTDTVEQMGIDRSLQASERAQIIILLTEPGVPYPDITVRPDQVVIRIVNKTEQFAALYGTGLSDLEQQLVDAVQLPTVSSGDLILTNYRHYQAMQEAHRYLQQVLIGIDSHLSSDLIAEDLKSVIDSLNSILGRSITSQDTLNNIFKNFCIGK